jgi:hypothetical protein
VEAVARQTDEFKIVLELESNRHGVTLSCGAGLAYQNNQLKKLLSARWVKEGGTCVRIILSRTIFSPILV